MTTVETLRRGIANEGGFFSPYYLFDLLGRRHSDELDLPGRDTNRRLLRPVYRRAWARLSGGSTLGEAWSAWYRELFTALGFLGETAHLRPLDRPAATTRYGSVPISHAAYLDGSVAPLVLVDLHGWGTDLDRDLYPDAGRPAAPGGEITREPIARAIELALDQGEARWALLSNGQELRLYRQGGSVARQYVAVHFQALFDGDRDDEWTAFWGLFRYAAFVPDPITGKCLLERILEESHRHASRIADDLRENVVTAVEALIQGILDDPANREVLQPRDQTVVQRLFEEALYFLYRLLFVLYAESRDLLPVGESPIYRDAYSLEHLRALAERPVSPHEGDSTYFIETLRTLFKMLQQGFPPPGSALHPGFRIAPFDGQLFDPRRTALLDRCRIPDRAMRLVVRELSLSRPRHRGGQRERYSYADLGVDQLGSIYEGLLVYEPAIVAEETVEAYVRGEVRLVGRAQAEEQGLAVVEGSLRRPGDFVLRLWGGRRKGSGSYYTPQEITSFLVKEALEPLVEPIIRGCGERDGRGRPRRRPEEILELKVCDPAMGSGAFLIQACRYLAEAYGRARIAAGEDEDRRISAEEFARYKRRVAERCLYGVDLNPLAVELAKVSLWLETLAAGRPLTFLDAHLRYGNSLIGAPLRDDQGRFTVERLSTIPDAALQEASKEATAGQKAAARERIRRNREEIRRLQPQRKGQMSFGADWGVLALREIEAALADTLIRRLDLETTDEDLPAADAVELVHEKELRFEELLHADDSRYRRAREVCDLWCAVWFWPSPPTLVLPQEAGVGGEDLPPPPTTQVFLELIGGILGADPGSLGEEERAAYLRTARHVAQAQRFFHWELEFPEVWRGKDGRPRRNGGFDAVVTNPPWETVKPNSKEFWSNYDPFFRDLSKQAALRRMAELRQDAGADRAWRAYSRTIEQTSRWLRESGPYAHQGRGDLNTYKLFLERAYRLLRPGGALSFVVPSGLYTDQGTDDLRRLFFEQSAVRCLVSLENRKGIFPIDSRFKFVLFAVERGGPAASIPCAFFIGKDAQGRDLAPDLAALRGILSNLEAHLLPVPLDAVRRFSPATLSLMEFKNRREMDIAARLYDGHPLLGEEVAGSWNVRFTTEFHMTNDSHLFRDRAWLEGHGCVEQDDRTWLGPDGERYLPLYEGKMIYHFDHCYDRPNYFIRVEGAQAKCRLENGRFSFDAPRICFRDITANTNERTLITALVPPGSIVTDRGPGTLPFGEAALYLAAVANSFVGDYIVRPRVTSHVKFYIWQQFPMPRLHRGHPCFDALVPRAARLTCTRPEFAPLWDEVARRYPQAMPAPWRPEAAASDPRERAALRAEIDALVADLYGLSEEDFAYILTTFPLLDRDQPALPGEPKSFITRDQALLELFRLRGRRPPEDIVAFFAAAGADIAPVTGPLRALEERVRQAWELGAVAYIPSRRGGATEGEEEIESEDEY